LIEISFPHNVHETIWTTRQPHIVENVEFYERTRHIEIDCHIIRKNLEGKIIVAKHVSSEHPLADLLTKPLGRTRVDSICDKLDMYDIYVPA